MKLNTCWHCKEPNLHFERVEDKWKLFDTKGRQHVCGTKKEIKPVAEELMSKDATCFVLKLKSSDEYYTGSTRHSKNFRDAKQFTKEELLNQRSVFEEAYVIQDYDALVKGTI